MPFVIQPNQVHGDRVVGVRAQARCRTCSARAREGADGVVVRASDVAAILCFADCVPIIAVSPAGSFAVVHAGWRGVVAHIAEKAVEHAVRGRRRGRLGGQRLYRGAHRGVLLRSRRRCGGAFRERVRRVRSCPRPPRRYDGGACRGTRLAWRRHAAYRMRACLHDVRFRGAILFLPQKRRRMRQARRRGGQGFSKMRGVVRHVDRTTICRCRGGRARGVRRMRSRCAWRDDHRRIEDRRSRCRRRGDCVPASTISERTAPRSLRENTTPFPTNAGISSAIYNRASFLRW